MLGRVLLLFSFLMGGGGEWIGNFGVGLDLDWQSQNSGYGLLWQNATNAEVSLLAPVTKSGDTVCVSATSGGRGFCGNPGRGGGRVALPSINSALGKPSRRVPGVRRPSNIIQMLLLLSRTRVMGSLIFGLEGGGGGGSLLLPPLLFLSLLSLLSLLRAYISGVIADEESALFLPFFFSFLSWFWGGRVLLHSAKWPLPCHDSLFTQQDETACGAALEVMLNYSRLCIPSRVALWGAFTA
jgi:hypothetical protein